MSSNEKSPLVIYGAEYIGEIPDILYIAPMQSLGDNMVRCTGCGNTIYCINPDTAICPLCSAKQIKSRVKRELL